MEGRAEVPGIEGDHRRAMGDEERRCIHDSDCITRVPLAARCPVTNAVVRGRSPDAGSTPGSPLRPLRGSVPVPEGRGRGPRGRDAADGRVGAPLAPDARQPGGAHRPGLAAGGDAEPDCAGERAGAAPRRPRRGRVPRARPALAPSPARPRRVGGRVAPDGGAEGGVRAPAAAGRSPADARDISQLPERPRDDVGRDLPDARDAARTALPAVARAGLRDHGRRRSHARSSG